jgi:hypothetical protein
MISFLVIAALLIVTINVLVALRRESRASTRHGGTRLY